MITPSPILATDLRHTAPKRYGFADIAGRGRAAYNRYGFADIVGYTAKMNEVFEQAKLAAEGNAAVLLRGETGTGKELIARAIHDNSPRAAGPFVKINCTGLPGQFEAEFFRAEKAALAGAMPRRQACVAMAKGGTLFFDEIGELSTSFQSKLVRVLEEEGKELRVIAAASRDLEAEVEAGGFCGKLYRLLHVDPIILPPLRERIGDIPGIARLIVARLADQQHRPLAITNGALQLLRRQRWPGNVRELQNCIERTAVMSEDGVIDSDLIRNWGFESFVPPRRIGNAMMISTRLGEA